MTTEPNEPTTDSPSRLRTDESVAIAGGTTAADPGGPPMRTDQTDHPDETAARGLDSFQSEAGAYGKRAVIYLRVSTDRQARSGGEAEGYSIPAQRDAARRKASALGAQVVDEYVDAGASAKTADRAALQAMLARLESQRDVDFVIVHKIDRLARNRLDDVLIMASIEKAGASLVSCSENIDESPQGKLLHGIMASMAEFYSLNLATEAKKGLHKKASRGGTPGPAPIGYLNVTTTIDGEPVKTVTIDDERVDHLRWAFRTYATGEWSLSELTEELDQRGLRSRPTRRYSGKALTRSQLHRVLSNRYYIGYVTYGGVTYPGNHDPLIDEATFNRVQDALNGRKVAGDRSWRLQQYLKGTVRCDRCGERLGFGHNTGRGGTYAYFFCLGRHRQRTSCDLPYLPADKVEAAVEAEWDEVTFTAEEAATTRRTVTTELDQRQRSDNLTIKAQNKRLRRLETKREKLLDAWMEGLIDKADFALRQQRLDAETTEAKNLVAAAQLSHEGVMAAVDLCLQLLEHAGLLYRTLDDDGRQTCNQARYNAIYFDADADGTPVVARTEVVPILAEVESVVRPHLKPLSQADVRAEQRSRRERLHRPSRSGRRDGTKHGAKAETAWRSDQDLSHLTDDRGSNLTNLAEREGFEPSDPLRSPVFKTGAFVRSATAPPVILGRLEPSLATLPVAGPDGDQLQEG